jgi:hypothetical protein
VVTSIFFAEHRPFYFGKFMMNEVDTIDHFSLAKMDNLRFAVSDPNSETGMKLMEIHHQIISRTDNFLTDIGGYFYQAQELLSNHKNGSFQQFVTACGYNTKTVERMVNRYKLIATNGRNIDYLESLPTRVLSEAGKTNADPEFKEKVLAREITSIKEMEEWKEEKKQMQADKEEIMKQRDQLAQERIKLDQQFSNNSAEMIRGMVDRNKKLVESARQDEREKAEKEFNARIKEEKKRIEEQLASEIRHHENNIANLENELAILRPLKKREAEIIEKQKQIDEAREEVYRAKTRNTLFDAVTKARKSFNDAIYPVVTVTMTPDIIGDTLKAEIQQLIKMTEDFAFALKQKFNL